MVLITGVTGFVGKAVAEAFLVEGKVVLAAARQQPNPLMLQHINLQWHSVGCINSKTQWQPALQGVRSVVHCAARAHVVREQMSDALSWYRKVNVEGTLHLAKQAAAARVERFVFISSIGVNGFQSSYPFTENSELHPNDSYAVSKLEAEQALLDLAAQTGMEVVIIRPPLVYGPGAPGNFGSLVRWVQSGLPLPFGAVNNQRSLVALGNLVSLILLCADRKRSPLAANEVFLVADGEDVSTSTLLRKVAHAAGLPSRLLSLPTWLLRAVANSLGMRAMADRLLGNLQVDANKARNLLGWQPVVNMDQQLASIFMPPHVAVSGIHNRPVLRVFDVLLAGTGLLILWPLLLVVCFLSWLDTSAPLFTQERIGRYQRPFVLVKFRTMHLGTPSMASHLVSSSSITHIGIFLRRTKLDELPQLWNVLWGQMSLVGPRPGLFSHNELTAARSALGVFAARPGITGLAQVKGIDMSTPELLAQTDALMLRELGIVNYFKFIWLTVTGQGSGDGVKAN